MTEQSIQFQNKEVYYRVTGKGPTVVLIHGFAETGEIWDQQVGFLEDHFRLIVPDIPGSGRSPLVEGATIETYAEIIQQILDKELPLTDSGEKEKPVMVGHSMGGYITLAFVEKNPAYLRSFCLFHSSAFADNEEKKQVRKKAIQFINENGAHQFLKTSIPGLFTGSFNNDYPERINELIEKGKDFHAASLVQYYEAMIHRPDRTGVLKTFDGPVMFIIGEHDQAIPLQVSLQQCYLPVKSTVHLFQQSAHMGMWEEPGNANQSLLAFLQ